MFDPLSVLQHGVGGGAGGAVGGDGGQHRLVDLLPEDTRRVVAVVCAELASLLSSVDSTTLDSTTLAFNNLIFTTITSNNHCIQ